MGWAGVFLAGFLLLPRLQAGGSPLEEAMDNMEDTKRLLYPALKQPVAADKDKYVTLAKVLQSEAMKARSAVPETAEKLPAADKDAMIAAFQKDMDEFVKTVGSLIEVLQKEQWDQVQAIVGKLREEEKAGHKAYRAKREKGGHGPSPAPAAASSPAPAAPAN